MDHRLRALGSLAAKQSASCLPCELQHNVDGANDAEGIVDASNPPVETDIDVASAAELDQYVLLPRWRR